MQSEENINRAFDLIIDYATELQLEFDLPHEVDRRLDLIVALARYQGDVRDTEERERLSIWKNSYNEALADSLESGE